jgi:DNA polymerase-3 subunit epsilon
MNHYNDNLSPSRDFVAIDVEYADAEQNICQIGLVVVRDLKIEQRRSWLIQPPGNHYEQRYSDVHGITAEDTAFAPSLWVAWTDISEYLHGWQIWAHNATSTEEPVINKNLRLAEIPETLHILDSRNLFQRPGCSAGSGNGLIQCCMALGISVGLHHQALDDAEMCAQIVIAYIEGREPVWDGVPVTSEEVRKAEQGKRVLRLGEFRDYYASTSSGYEDVFAVLSSTCDGAQEQTVDVFDKGDVMPGENSGEIDFARLNCSEDNPVRGKTVVFTGVFNVKRDDIKKALDAMGAKHPSSISGKTYAVIFGTKNISFNKLCDIEEQEEKGHHIFRIVGNEDLEEFLYGDTGKFFRN